ncbi:hypothetical protein IAT38_004387 [Cryptococcus sp. DSM 104549]
MSIFTSFSALTITNTKSSTFPPFSALPITNSGPPLNAWGLYGPRDDEGRVNLITAESDKRAMDTMMGMGRISLNLPLSLFPNFKEGQALDHEVHYPYPNYPKKGQYQFYNGMTLKEVTDPSSRKFGIYNFSKQFILSRGHLLDIPRYLAANSLPPLSPLSNTSKISVSTLQACAAAQGVSFLPGDVLVVRTGYTEAVIDLSDEERDELRKRGVNGCCGVDPSTECIKWHWENGFAAVASDSVAYEAYPPPRGIFTCHDVFVGGWGLPIGELLDLRELAKRCEELGRWTFSFSSMPVEVVEGIANPYPCEIRATF